MDGLKRIDLVVRPMIKTEWKLGDASAPV